MNSKSKGKVPLFFLYGLSFVIILLVVNSQPIDHYVETLKQEQLAVEAISHSMKQEIAELAIDIDEEPINARSDRIWKAIPGYNGLQVDLQKSIELSHKLGRVSLDSLVIREIEPEVKLEDLPPQAIYRGNPKKPMVSFMVNVAWGTEYLEEMLKIFEEYQVKATFFLDGSWLAKNEEIAKKLIEQGHEIGNHAYTHPDLRKMSKERIEEEIIKTDQLIRNLGVRSYLFAPPSGAYDQRVVNIAAQHHYKTIMWSLDTVDWRKPAPAVIVERIVPHLENGSTILMHPTESTVEALRPMIEGALQKELMMGTISELISPERTISVVRLE